MVDEEMYLMKTMCLAKKTVQMPTKEEHGFLLFCGLGARKWQVQMECNSLSFKQAILNIYPRLRSAVGYNLWTLTRDKKTFERIPEKVNTPRRIRSYLGSQFTGCLIIVPISDILLMEEKREHLRQMDMKDLPGCPRISLQDQERLQRSLCMLCGKMEKMAGTGSFHKINTEEINCSDGTVPIVKKLTEILGVNIEAHRKKFIASEEICKKCLRAMIDISQMEIKLKSAREDLINNFFTTTSRFNKNHQSSSSSSGNTHSSTSNNTNSHTSHNSNDKVNGMKNGLHENLEEYRFQQGILMPTMSSRPLAFMDPRQAAYNVGPPPPDMYQICSVAGIAAAAAAANMKNDNSALVKRRHNGGSSSSKGAGGSTSSSEHINYVRNPNYRSRPGSEYAFSEVGSSSYISVSPLHCGTGDMNGSDSGSEPVSPRPFDQQSMASTFSFASQASSNQPLKSKAQYKDYNCMNGGTAANGENANNGQGQSSSSVTATGGAENIGSQLGAETAEDNGEKGDEVHDYSMNSNGYANGKKTDFSGIADDKIQTELGDDNVADTTNTTIINKESEGSPPHQHVSPSSTSSSGPSPPSSSPRGSDSASPSRGYDAAGDDYEIRKPVKKRKRASNTLEEHGGVVSALLSLPDSLGPFAKASPESHELEIKKRKSIEEQ